MVEIIYSRELHKLIAKRPELKGRIEEVAIGYFPEVERARFGRASRRAYYDFRTGTVRLTGRSSRYVIGHELVHLLQDGRHCGGLPLPAGERSCDVFLFARSPALVADVWGRAAGPGGDSSYLLRGALGRALAARFPEAEGRLMVHAVCAEAVRRRAAGRRNYIRWAEGEISARVKARAVVNP